MNLNTSLELFTNISSSGDHVYSVQRMRLGLSRNTYQFGLGYNIGAFGPDYIALPDNPGLFIRKEF
ncbi:MAG: hypothetical protein ABR95_13010 [Sphingobacteriales bacterium BACL12 MAG-120813-bin55]|jgi:hypothetical protein|nr:MAG: hypothetical protein ABR94_03165 [Sphingobacteriales bacterium BACL12 MAG-120802-bin5]KRP11168.1 MAG: hypothetical protein ABR95_13010 [Sphingobacteriales bacterium BACL12 MAG-120813-bin55]